MKKIRLIKTTIKEYIPNPDYYPKGLGIEEMAQLDVDTGDVNILFEDDENIVERITWEIIDEGDGRECTRQERRML